MKTKCLINRAGLCEWIFKARNQNYITHIRNGFLGYLSLHRVCIYIAKNAL
jgi:hypothetical protein